MINVLNEEDCDDVSNIQDSNILNTLINHKDGLLEQFKQIKFLVVCFIFSHFPNLFHFSLKGRFFYHRVNPVFS